MSKYRVRWDANTGEKVAEWKDGDLVYWREQQTTQAPMVMGDIKPYTSMIDGSEITSRNKHRAHLRQHNCIEIGNEKQRMEPKPLKSPPGLKETLIRVAYEKLRGS